LALNKTELIKFKVGLENIGEMNHEELQEIYDCNINFSDFKLDEEPIDSIDKKETK
jgi:hypothetical protein